jgi:hypothetical protein
MWVQASDGLQWGDWTIFNINPPAASALPSLAAAAGEGPANGAGWAAVERGMLDLHQAMSTFTGESSGAGWSTIAAGSGLNALFPQADGAMALGGGSFFHGDHHG